MKWLKRRRVSRTSVGRSVDHDAATELRVPLDTFSLQALSEAAAHQRESVEQLAAYAVTYYLADLDSGRLLRNLLRLGAPPPNTGAGKTVSLP